MWGQLSDGHCHHTSIRKVYMGVPKISLEELYPIHEGLRLVNMAMSLED